jgi:hypothetical protein
MFGFLILGPGVSLTIFYLIEYGLDCRREQSIFEFVCISFCESTVTFVISWKSTCKFMERFPSEID